jgi:aspartyl-tRNA(Asn)/glutamyl-tRNA(Gln) amidotransferase subunit A
MIGKGLALSETTYRDDRTRLAAARATFWRAFPETDAILFPAAPQTAPAGLASTGDPRYIGPWTALGGPIVTLPIGHHTNGLPIGMLVCGRPGSDRALARIACALDALVSSRRMVSAHQTPTAGSRAREESEGRTR